MFQLNLAPASVRELFVIDAALPDIQSLINAIGPDKWIVVLDSQRDGVLQLADLLSDQSDLDAVHVLSHGSVGSLNLGTAVLNQASLGNYSQALVTIGKALTETGDLLLYGCDVAQGDVGQAFIRQLATLTGADVAASVDATGAARIGGNWALEASAGTVDTAAITVSQSVFDGLLGDWPDDPTGIHWNQPLALADMPFTIPAYGRYGGPGWTNGTDNNFEGTPTDDLDGVFFDHDMDYVNANDNSSLLAAADTVAILKMIGLQYNTGSDMQAYAGATTLAFLLQIQKTYESTYSGSFAVALAFGLASLQQGLDAIEVIDQADSRVPSLSPGLTS